MKRGVLVRIESSEFAYFDGMHALRQQFMTAPPMRVSGGEPDLFCMSHTTRELPVHIIRKSRYRLDDRNGQPKLDLEGRPIREDDETYLAVEPEILSLISTISDEERNSLRAAREHVRALQTRVSNLVSTIAAFNAMPWYKKVWAALTSKGVLA